MYMPEKTIIRSDTDYALRMLVHLAESGPEGVATKDLSAALNVPHGFAQKILRQLAAVGMLEAKPGRSGGFRFVKRPDDITFADVIAAIQGPPLLNKCTGGKKICPRQPGCRVGASLRGFQRKLDGFLASTTLADIVGVSSVTSKRRRK